MPSKSPHEELLKRVQGLEQEESGREQTAQVCRQSELKRKNAEAERERLMSAVEQSTEVIVITGTDGAMHYVNPAFEKITGYTRREAIGANPRILKSGVQDQAFYAEMWDTLTAGRTWRGCMVNRRKDGSFYTEECSISPVLNESGAIVNYVGVKRDITREIDLEKRLANSQRIEAIGALAGGIAHDFNNILFPITGMAEMLLEDIPPAHPHHDFVNEIHKAAKRAGALVKQILAFSRQSNQQKIPVRLPQILKEALNLSRATIPSNIEIHADIQSDCGLVLADPSQLHQIVMNLITNAYHAVEETCGAIMVGLKEIPSSRIDVAGGSLAPGPYAVLRVSDTGPGIDPSLMHRIFEPYFTTKPLGKGTGLGLSVVHGIVTEYGGEIQVKSNPGMGAVFEVVLPLMAKSTETAYPETVTAYETGTERVLLVDDEEPIVRLEIQMLERLGYRVTACFGSMEAVETFRSDPQGFDLVLTDMAMPHMTGAQLAEKLISVRPDIPIIICTGFSETINEEKAKTMGIKGFLMKPVVKSDMARLIRKVLDAGKP